MRRYLIWDFDGTLGYRYGGWSGTLLEVLRQSDEGCSVLREHFIPYLQSGYPWHTPHTTQPAERSAEEWWRALEPIFRNAFSAVGCADDHALDLAGRVRSTFTCCESWSLFDDSLAALEEFSRDGWTHLILSNHVPELPAILDHLGILPLIDRVFNSAQTGIEKPHRQAFLNVVDSLEPGACMWMIGDNVAADIEGAAAVGIPGILVRSKQPTGPMQCDRLHGMRAILAKT